MLQLRSKIKRSPHRPLSERQAEDALREEVFNARRMALGYNKKKLLELLPYLSDKEMEVLEELISLSPGAFNWLPQPGPQTMAFHSLAQMLLYGGAAGGGKTDLLLGVGYAKHHRSIIYRRDATQLVAMVERSHEIFAGVQGAHFSANPVNRGWRFNGSVPFGKKVEFGGVHNPGEERKYQGRAHDLKGFDELPHFARKQFDYLRGWLRSVVYGLNWQIIGTCNPPTSVEERWINDYWPNWIDRNRHPQLETPGKLLYFIMHDGKSIQVDGPGNHRYRNREFTAMSRTFIPSKVTDNMYLDDGQYKGVLESLPEPLRSQLLNGDFQAGISDDEWQLIPTDWIILAQQRWRNRTVPEGIKKDQTGVDVARGGRDRMVAVDRSGNYFYAPRVLPGKVVTNGRKAAFHVLSGVTKQTLIVVDVIGVGSSCFDFLVEDHSEPLCVAFNGSEASIATDKSGFLRFRNQRAEGYWKLREALDPQASTEDIALPDDPEVLADLQAITFQPTPMGIQIAAKEDIIDKLGRSPDYADAIMYAFHQPFREGQGVFDYVKQAAETVEKAKKERAEKERKEKENMIRINDMSMVRTDQ